MWWSANTLEPWAPNAIPFARLAAVGLNINNPADQQLLVSQVNSPLAASRGFGGLPFPEFPPFLTVFQALRQLPEYTGIVQYFNPIGKTWYDALQTKATKRFSHGLDALVTYTWSRNLILGAEDNNQYSSPTPPIVNDVYNRMNSKSLSGLDQPQVLTVAANYTTPKVFAGRSGFTAKTGVLARPGLDLRRGSALRERIPLPGPRRYHEPGFADRTDHPCGSRTGRALVHGGSQLPLYRSHQDIRTESGGVGESAQWPIRHG